MPIGPHCLTGGPAPAFVLDTMAGAVSPERRCPGGCSHGSICPGAMPGQRARRYWQLADSDDASSTTERLVNHRGMDP